MAGKFFLCKPNMDRPTASTTSAGPIRRIAVWLICVVIIGLVAFHLGPPWAFFRPYTLMASLVLADGNTLCVISHRTPYILEPYEVNLYRIWPDGTWGRFYLSHEDSYWWGASLHRDAKTGQIHIRACGELAAIYNREDNEVVLVENGHRIAPQPAPEAVKLRHLLQKGK
jgi:hypothetical protein